MSIAIATHGTPLEPAGPYRAPRATLRELRTLPVDLVSRAVQQQVTSSAELAAYVQRTFPKTKRGPGKPHLMVHTVSIQGDGVHAFGLVKRGWQFKSAQLVISDAAVAQLAMAVRDAGARAALS